MSNEVDEAFKEGEREFYKQFGPLFLLSLGMVAGVFTGLTAQPKIHTEKAGCEYAEQTQCVQRWVRDESRSNT